MQQSIRISLSLTGATALALASIPQVNAKPVQLAQGAADDLGVMSINLKDVVKPQLGVQGQTQAAGTPSEAAVNAEAVSDKWAFNAYPLIPTGDTEQVLNTAYQGDALNTYGLDVGYSISPDLRASVAATASPNSAMEQSAFKGFYAQLGIGFNDVLPSADNVSLTLNSGPFAGRYDRKTSYNNIIEFTGTITAGYMTAISEKFLLGVGIEYMPIAGETQNAVTVGSAGVKTYSTYTTLNHLNFFLSPAYALDKNKIVYAKAGYSQSESDVDFGIDGSPNHSTGGYVLGLGYKQIITGGLYAFAEVNYFMYSSTEYKTSGVNQFGDSFVSTQDIKSNGYNLLAGFGYTF